MTTSDKLPCRENACVSSTQSSTSIVTTESSRPKQSNITDDENGQCELLDLARILSQRSNTARQALPSTTVKLTYLDDPLDPNSPNFSLQEWLKSIVSKKSQQGIPSPATSVMFRDLDVFGSGSWVKLQETVITSIIASLRLREIFNPERNEKKKILSGFNGILKGGELLMVLGRPSSGCSTLLKTICGEHQGLTVGKDSKISYCGVPLDQITKEFKGEVLYNQELDQHFPHLTVGQTLELAASYRAPKVPPNGMTTTEWVKFFPRVVMAIFGLSHTYHTKVGNDFIRGVSGGERKRVSIAEMTLADARVAAWDNSTRGLDSATALSFVKALHSSATITGAAHAVAIYQASQAIYEVFDKVTLLYDGRQIFFGPVGCAKGYFEEMGWVCPPRQTTADFLTAVTNASERKPREGMELKVPRTADEFERYWHESSLFAALRQEMDEYDRQVLNNGSAISELRAIKHHRQGRLTRQRSPYTISVLQQVKINMWRAYLRIAMDPSSTVIVILSRIIQAVIFGSIFYGTMDATQGFYAKASVLLFSVLLNALVAMAEVQTLFPQRPIVEKHKSYAFYHPFTEALATSVLDIPVKFIVAVVFNIIIYFLGGLRREAGPFFLFFLVSYLLTLTMSAFFRAVAAATRSVAQAMAIGGVMFIIMLLYSGFMIPLSYMKPWFKWLHWLNPAYYAFEMVMSNEFHGRVFVCSGFVPAYNRLSGRQFVCAVPGAKAGSRSVSGDEYIQAQYGFSFDHFWRNFGILVGFLVVSTFAYLVVAEVNSLSGSSAKSLVFLPGRLWQAKAHSADEEATTARASSQAGGQDNVNFISPQKGFVTWKDVCYDIQIEGETRRLLDNVCGWVKPGSLTALMGASGAGKTTLLDVIAQRVSTGVVSGEFMANGRSLGKNFARQVGYVQQQDLHLDTATVRESIYFSAILRQPASISRAEKCAYAESVIKTLEMDTYADAVVGRLGEGLNLEQRKRLTIAIELAAKPDLLLFLDEPTSGLDSQSSWEICSLLRKLADRGQAILCTIHQPSAALFEQFHRLLLLGPGGRTLYFGDIGEHSRSLVKYFEKNGARECGPHENPAEYILEVTDVARSGTSDEDWHRTWLQSTENTTVLAELDDMSHPIRETPLDQGSDAEYATPLSAQIYLVSRRVFQQYWRSPSYIWSKIFLGAGSGLFIGFSFFQSDNTLQGSQNVIFAVFGVCAILSSLSEQILPFFVFQRALYEVRERPSKTYSWKAFLIANILVEIPYQVLTGIVIYASFYYSLAGIQSSERQGLVLLFCIQFFIYASSFAHLVVAAMPDTQSAGAIIVLLFSMMLSFNGVLLSPTALPGFWIFMYRISPLTYWVGGIVATILHDRPIQCSKVELSVFDPPAGQTCGEYLAPYLVRSPGTLLNPESTKDCQFCALSTADQYVSQNEIVWAERWRNWGIVWIYVVFNIVVATALYFVFRVRVSSAKRKIA
ncbi:hypothetical protein Asppvi_005969 [Aspergillus pseudoviridinutans]|uniref:ABC transporter domain-containing protein n=1 Tax=Aspergillus pseudoviridinutans TaxID=1517512 RepID=A0A9P3EUX5_9EURO|nr:uncharacterized protein Asppvi_005969 [Aspergillus pseudoviridinutans]GIJ87067.1 hypothetical protein Asppvi_005969 [Aspergillus pseudoviridinutans]